MDEVKIKELIVKARYIWGGLVVAYIPHELEQASLILNLEKSTFLSGLASGICIGMKVIGVCLFAYGIAHYGIKAGIHKNGR